MIPPGYDRLPLWAVLVGILWALVDDLKRGAIAVATFIRDHDPDA